MAPSFSPSTSQDSFADLLSTIIVFVNGELAEGGRYWAYLAMKPTMAKPFMDARDGRRCELEDFGTIIEWGKGDKPPAEVIERMQREYAADPDYEQKLLKKLSEISTR